jgi:uncharacterized protein YlaI
MKYSRKNPVCRVCKVVLTEENRYPTTGFICSTCFHNKYQHWKELHPETYRISQRRHHLKKYGITIEEYDVLFKKQEGKCAICDESKPVRKRDNNLHVDHDHNNNQIRGLLCDNCNKGLGHFKDSVPLLQRAVNYLVGCG